MSPDRLRQRQRIMRARVIMERIAKIDHLAAQDAQADAAGLAQRLMREIALIDGGGGPVSGAQLSARGALAMRLQQAAHNLFLRELELVTETGWAASRSLSARVARRSAEMLAERALEAVDAAAEARVSVPRIRQGARR
jgi:hypothetical protein